MKLGSFEFNLREFSGALGDLGTLIPLVVGYIAVCGLNPAGLLVMLGLANIITGCIYRLPMPIQPMKVLAVVAIAQAWPPSMVYAAAFAMGLIWVLFSCTKLMDRLARITPNSVVMGIQIALGVLLALQALPLLQTSWPLAALSLAVVMLLHGNPRAPAAVVLMALGILIMLIKGQGGAVSVAFTLPPLSGFQPAEVWNTLVLAGFAQIPLTATNAVIATAALIKTYWPDKPVSERRLALNMGLMNLISPFFGGMPLCHGAGGLAGQYYFGARTGGTNILEGILELALGLLLASSIVSLFTLFPGAIIGAMMLLVGIEMVGFAKDMHFDQNLIPLGITVAAALATNMALGFICGLAAHHLLSRMNKEKKHA